MPDYIVSDYWNHVFDGRRGEDAVRFVLSSDTKEILAMDVRASQNRGWAVATDAEIADVAEELETTGNLDYALMEAEVDETDEVPKWAASRVLAKAALRRMP